MVVYLTCWLAMFSVEGRRCARVMCMVEDSGSIKRGAIGLQRFKESAVPGMYWGDRYYTMNFESSQTFRAQTA